MLCASAYSTSTDTALAIQQVCDSLQAQLETAPALVFVFVSHDHRTEFDAIGVEIARQLSPGCLLGCSAEAVLANDTEMESEPAIAVWAARLPGTRILPMHLQFERTPDGGSIIGWPDELTESWPEDSVLMLLGDPFSFPTDSLLERLNEDQPGIPIVGGMASGAGAPGENALFLNGERFRAGAVAALLSGDITFRSIVSQGCRPIGTTFIVTKAEQNVIHELGGQPALLQLKEVFDTLPTREKQLVQSGLHVGRVVSEYQDHREQGDFLVRNVLGLDAEQGAIVVGDYIRPGQTIQFHVRDEQTASDEWQELLAQTRDDSRFAPAGGLLFTCNGRGTRLFSQPHHDAGCAWQTLGQLPLAGFFAQGEIGPVGRTNFVHGFTASLVLFGEKAS